MNTRVVPTLALALLLAACATFDSASGRVGQPLTTSPAPTGAASQSPTMTPPPDCVNPPPNLTTLIQQADPLPCYGNTDLTVDAHLTGGAFDCPGGLEPAWLGCAGMVGLYPLPGTSGQPQFVLVARSRGGFVSAVIHPDIEAQRLGAMDTLVHLTGHYDDPAAKDCHYTSWPDANPPSPEEVVLMCRSTFVITAMEFLAL